MLTVLLLWWGLASAAEPVDEAMNALAEGRTRVAMQRLHSALADDPDHAIRCLLGQVALRADRPEEALAVLQQVPPQADCALQAAFTAAEALVALERLEDAAARYEVLGDDLLGPDRHRATAARLGEWAQRLADEGKGREAQGVLALSLTLTLAPERRLQLARKLAAMGGRQAAEVLQEAIASAQDLASTDRRLLAPLLPPAEGMALLAPLPEDGPTRVARARVAAGLDLATRQLLTHALIEASPELPEARELALAVGRQVASEGWVEEAEALLGPLTPGDDAIAAAATWTLARLAATEGADEAEDRIRDAVARFPLADFRREAEALLDSLRRERARSAAGALDVAYRSLLEAHPDDPELALEAAWTLSGRAQLERLEEIAARWPSSRAARTALEARVQLDPEGGWAWLETQASTGRGQAAHVHSALRQPHLALRSPGRQGADPVVELAVRNVGQVEMRVHRIDLEGFVRAGRGPDDLDGLDVGIIAPDHTWTVDLPDPGTGRHAVVEVPVEVRRPGLYVVTAATPEEEASAPLLLSDVELVARRVGQSLVAAAFRDGRPAADARLLVGGERAVEGRADATGLVRVEVPDGPLVVLAQTRGGPALLALDAASTPSASPVRVAVDLDRPLYRPGDTVRFRAVATADGEPLRGRWRLQLEGGVVHQVLRLSTDRQGAITGELVLPLHDPGGSRDGLYTRDLVLTGVPPGRDGSQQLARIPMAGEQPPGHSLQAEREGDEVVFTLRDGQGLPVADAAVQIRQGTDQTLQRTDQTGRVRVAAPPPGLRRDILASVPSSRLSASAPTPDPVTPLRWTVEDPRWLPGRPGRLLLDGASGPVTVRVVRKEAGRTQPEAPRGPALWEHTSVQAYQPGGPQSAGTPEEVRRTVHTLQVQLDGPTEITVPGLETGRYEVVAIAADGRVGAARAELEVDDSLRLRIDGTPRVGGAAALSVEGGAALVTVERGRLLDAMVLRRGQTRLAKVDPTWHGEVSVIATRPDDRHVRKLTPDAHLDVGLSARAAQGRWIVEATVRDAAGQPVQADVLLRGLDAQLVAEVGPPSTLSLHPFLLPAGAVARSAVARDLTAVSLAVPIAASLREESLRLAQAKKKERAREGRLDANAARQLLGEDVPLQVQEMEMASFGTSGSGYGAGGGASHGIGVRGGQARALGRRTLDLRGRREAALWEIVPTDAQGRARLDVAAPDGWATWRIDAVALGAGAVGRAETTVEPPDLARMVVDPVAPGWPGDEARPRVRVLAPAGGAEVELEVGGAVTRLALGPGEVGTVQLPPTAPGQGHLLSLRQDGQEIDRREWRFPVAAGIPDPEGPIAVSLGGTRGTSALEVLALQPDALAAKAPGRAAVAGRAALAAWPHLDPAGRRRAEAVIRGAVGAVREAGSLRPEEAAQAVLLVAEAAPVLGLPRSVVEEMVEGQASVEPRSPRERLMLTWARTTATGSAEEATVGRLVRDADLLDAEERALLARLLHLAGERFEPGWVEGSGPQAVLAGRLPGVTGPAPDALLAHAPPELGDPARPDWVRAAGRLLARAEGGAGLVRTVGEGAVAGRLAWREAVPGGVEPDRPLLGRLPAAPDGRPSPLDEPATCGTEAAPCRLALGEGLNVRRVNQARASSGLGEATDDQLLVARAPGRFRLVGLRTHEGPLAPIAVEVVDAPDAPRTPLGEAGLLRAAELALGRGEDPLPLLAQRPSLEDWSPWARSQVARLRFLALDGAAGEALDPSLLVAAFEDLRDEAPQTPIELDAVARTARAYRAAQRPDRARTLWRRALGQAFLAEAQVATSLESWVGPLASLTVLREATQRFPAVPLVEQAAFALPDRLLDVADNLPSQARERGVTPTDIRLMAASWDRSFLGLHPDSPLAPEAGLRLATGLLDLGARERALSWARRLMERHPDHALMDQWLLLAAQVEMEEGRAAAARRDLTRLAEEELPLGGGQLGPSPLRDDARFALGRLAEAHDRLGDAREWYVQVSGAIPEAFLALSALQSVHLEVPQVVRVGMGEGAQIEVRATNLDEVHVSAFAVDLRTLFLRESGLPRAADLRVEGLAPAWTGTRRLKAGPFPVEQTVSVPVSGPGAWLIRLDGDRASTATLLIRSNLQLATTDGDQRRLALRAGSKPASGAGIRALSGSGVVATETDARGVAIVPTGAPALAWQGSHYAFSEDAWVGQARRTMPAAAPASKRDVLKGRQEDRERMRRQQNRMQYDFIGQEVQGSIDASEL